MDRLHGDGRVGSVDTVVLDNIVAFGELRASCDPVAQVICGKVDKVVRKTMPYPILGLTHGHCD